MNAGSPVRLALRVALGDRARAARCQSRRAISRSRTLVAARRVARDEQSMVTRCAWCLRMSVDGGWHEPAAASLFPGALARRTTHGICPDCLQALADGGQTASLGR